MEASSRFVSPGYTKVVFEIHAPGLQSNEVIAVIGRHENIGAWDASKCLPMTLVDEETHLWRANAWLPTAVATPYKYVVLENGPILQRMVKWETIVGSRFILPGVANLARAKPSWQSSTYKRHEASKAVNGSFFATAYNCSMTMREVDPWWQVDLGTLVPIERLNVWTRPHPECSSITVTLSSHPVFPIPSSDGYQDSLASMPDSRTTKTWVSKRWRINPDETYDLLPWQVGRELRSGKTKPTIRNPAGDSVTWGGDVTSAEEPDVPCFRFVAVRGHGYASLQLAEVEVFSLISDIIASNAQCVKSPPTAVEDKLAPCADEGLRKAALTAEGVHNHLLPQLPEGGKTYVMWSEHSRYTVQLAPLGTRDKEEFGLDEEEEFPSEQVDEDLASHLEASTTLTREQLQPRATEPKTQRNQESMSETLERLKASEPGGSACTPSGNSLSRASVCPSSGPSQPDDLQGIERKDSAPDPGSTSEPHGNMQLSLWSDRGLLPVAILQEVFDGVFGVDIRQPQPEARAFTDSFFLGQVVTAGVAAGEEAKSDGSSEAPPTDWDPGCVKIMLGGLVDRPGLTVFDTEGMPEEFVGALVPHLSIGSAGKLRPSTELFVREVEHPKASIIAWFISFTVAEDPAATLSITFTYPLPRPSKAGGDGNDEQGQEPTIEHIPVAQAYLVKDGMTREDVGEFSVPILALPGMMQVRTALEEQGKPLNLPMTPYMPIGQALLRFLVVRPFKHSQNNISRVWRTYWRARPTLHVGHRGVGRSYKQTKGFRKAALRENTLISFITASAMGSDLIEFDVLLTSDRVPVVYHDFQLEVAIANKTAAREEEMETGIHELKWRQLRAIKLHHLREGIKRTGLARLLRKHWGGVIEYAKKRKQSLTREHREGERGEFPSNASVLSDSSYGGRKAFGSASSVRSDMAFSSAASEFSSSSSVQSYGSESGGGFPRATSSEDMRRLLHPDVDEQGLYRQGSPDPGRASPARLRWSPTAIERANKGGYGARPGSSREYAGPMASPPHIVEGQSGGRDGMAQGVALAAPVPRPTSNAAAAAATSDAPSPPVPSSGTPVPPARGPSPFKSMDVAEEASRPSSRGSITDYVYRSRTPKGADIGSLSSALHEIPSLQALFMHLPPHLGFDVEIKYPTELKHRAIGQHDIFRRLNAYVDSILKIVFEYGEKRRIMFSCFNPEICTLLRLKQARYPVLFLSDAGKSPLSYGDKRCRFIEPAIDFAKTERLQGVVAESRPILNDPSLVEHIHSNGLLLFTWGDRNTDPRAVELQRSMGVDAVISDNIGDHTTAVGKVSQFLKWDDLQQRLRLPSLSIQQPLVLLHVNVR